MLVPGRMETFHWVVVQSIFCLLCFFTGVRNSFSSMLGETGGSFQSGLGAYRSAKLKGGLQSL